MDGFKPQIQTEVTSCFYDGFGHNITSDGLYGADLYGNNPSPSGWYQIKNLPESTNRWFEGRSLSGEIVEWDRLKILKDSTGWSNNGSLDIRRSPYRIPNFAFSQSDNKGVPGVGTAIVGGARNN